MGDLYLERPIYSFDTSSFIDFKNFYPKDVFLWLYPKMLDLFKSGKITVVQTVIDEIEMDKVGNELCLELISNIPNSRKHMLDDHIIESKRIVNQYYAAFSDSHLIKADPQIIACAGKYKYIIVTQEMYGGMTKIPTICKKEGIQCINIVEFMRNEGFSH